MERISSYEIGSSIPVGVPSSTIFDGGYGLDVDEYDSDTPKHLMEDSNSNLLPSQKKLRNHIAKITQQIAIETSDDKAVQLPTNNDYLSPFTTSARKKSFKKLNSSYSFQVPSYARERKSRETKSGRQQDANMNYYEMYLQLTNKYELLVADNIKQKDLFKLRQETFVRREKRSKEKLDELTEKLRMANTVRGNSREQMDQLHSLKRTIQTKIQMMKGETQKQLEERQEQYQRHVDDLIQDYKQQLLEERRKNSTGVKEWNEKSRSLKENLKNATIKAVELDEKNSALIKENQRLKIQYKAQQDDREYLAKINAKMKRENEKLREEIRDLELEMETLRTITENNSLQTQRERNNLYSSFDDTQEHNQHMDSFDVENREKKMLETINKLKRMLDQERKNSKAMRNAHLLALSERSEIEIFLRQCIDDVRLDIGRHQAVLRSVSQSQETIGQLQDFTIMDRQKVVDILLSKERVLKLLFQKTFPTKILPGNDGAISTTHHEEEQTQTIDRSMISMPNIRE